MHKLVLLRHGQSTWNLENRFTGWTDVPLSENGVAEAHKGAAALKEEGFAFDVAFTSVLKRAIKTLWIVLEDLDLMWIDVLRSWRLNERHYGALQGLDKKETVQKHGAEQVQIWRRGYAVRPPELTREDPRFPGNDLRFSMTIPSEELPVAESLSDTVKRVLPYWHSTIAPSIKRGSRVLIAAHGNSLRALVKYLDEISEDKIVGLNIPTGIPLVYELDNALRPTRHYYLGDPDEVAKAMESVASQTKR